MKPGSGDIRYDVMIEGAELEELKMCTGAMAESFGLDRRIEKYQGKRPIGLYRWDIECMVMAIEWSINDLKVKSGKNTKEIAILQKLYVRMKKLEDVAFA